MLLFVSSNLWKSRLLKNHFAFNSRMLEEGYKQVILHYAPKEWSKIKTNSERRIGVKMSWEINFVQLSLAGSK